MTNLTDAALRQLLSLNDDADLNQSFSDLEVDSWDLIETRTVLENRFGLNFTDDQWMALERPSDILLRGTAA